MSVTYCISDWLNVSVQAGDGAGEIPVLITLLMHSHRAEPQDHGDFVHLTQQYSRII